MIGKLIIIGAIVIAVLVFVPGSFKTVTDVIIHQVTNDKKQSNSNPSSQQTPDSNQPPGFGGTLVNQPNSQTPASQSSAQSNSGKTPDNSQSPSAGATTSGTTTPGTTPTGTTTTSPSSGGGSQPTTGTTVPTSSLDGGSQHPTATPTNSLSTNTELASLPSSIADFYTVIQLKSTQQGNNVLITYDDTSKKTTSVVVSLKNSDKEIFSGTFTSSMFQATIEDVPNSPHIIEMTVQHSVYGTLHGSAYVPAGNSNSTISGIFTKS